MNKSKIKCCFHYVFIVCFVFLFGCENEESENSLGIPVFLGINEATVVATEQLFVKWRAVSNAEYYEIHRTKIGSNSQESSSNDFTSNSFTSRQIVSRYCPGVLQSVDANSGFVARTEQTNYFFEELEIGYEYAVRAIRTVDGKPECSIFSSNFIRPTIYVVSAGSALPVGLVETIFAINLEIETTRRLKLPKLFKDDDLEYRLRHENGDDIVFDNVNTLRAGKYTIEICNRTERRVCSEKSAFQIELSVEVEFIPEVEIPEIPVGLETSNIGVSSFVLNWERVTDATGYNIRGNGSILITGSSAQISGLVASTRYVYQVQACNQAGCSDFSNFVTVSTTAVTNVPSVPENLRITSSSDTSIGLAWDIDNQAESYVIFRDDFEVDRVLPVNYADTALLSNTPYSYRVQACNRLSCSASTDSVGGRTKLTAPTNLRIINLTDTSVDLAWNAVAGATIYKIVGGDNAIEVPDNSIVINDLDSGSIYNYRVRACNNFGCSEFSLPILITTTPSIPTGLRAISSNVSGVDLMWNTVMGATNYNVVGAGTIIIDDNTAQVSGLVMNNNYMYEVQACNVSGCSEFSLPILVTTLAPTAIPDNVVNLRVESSTDNSIEIRWDVNNQAERYVVFLDGLQVAEELAARYINMGLAPNMSYNYKVQACNRLGCSTSSDAIEGRTKLSKPTNLQTVFVGTDSIELSWEAVSEATNYLIYRDNILETILNGITNFDDDNLESGINYNYKVEACNVYGCSEQSEILSVATRLNVPINLVVTDIEVSKISIMWSVVTNADSYEVTGDGSGIVVTELTAEVSGLTANSTYSYRVRACNIDAGCSDFSDSASATTLSPMATPDTPASVMVASNTSKTIRLTWNSISEAENYVVYRHDDVGNFLISSDTSNNFFTDMDLTPDTLYQYKVQACNSYGCSQLGASFTDARTKLSRPTNLRATDVSVDSYTLDWDSVEGAISYDVSGDGGTTGIIDSLLKIDNLTPNISYVYQVKACNINGCSNYSDPFVVTIQAQMVTLVLTVNNIMTGSVSLNWNDIGANDYQIYRNDVSIFLGNSVSYSDSGLVAGTSYDYYVKACNGGDCFASSDVIATVTIPAPPQNIMANSITTTSVSLSWDATGIVSDYILYKDGDVISTIATTSTTDNGLESGTTADYQVQACNISGCSDFSNTESIITVPAIPTNLVASNITVYSVDLSWDAVKGAYYYEIEEGSDVVTSDSNAVEIDSLTSGMTYSYRVRACNVSCSNFSTPEQITTRVPTTAPDIPQDFKVTASTDVSITLEWVRDFDATSYMIYRYNADRSILDRNSVMNDMSYTDVSLDSDTFYQYELQACNMFGCSASTDFLFSHTKLPVPNLNAVDITTDGLTLSWEAVVGAIIYRVGGHFDGIITSDFLRLDGLTGGTTYDYRVQACNMNGCSNPSSISVRTANVVAMNVPLKPILEVVSIKVDSVDLSWDGEGVINYYQIYRDDIQVDTRDGSINSYTDVSLDAGSYRYYIKACNNLGCSVSSDTSIAMINSLPLAVPSVPTGLRDVNITSNSIELVWNEVADANSYEVTGDGTILVTGVSGAISDLSADTGYFYSVRACNIRGCSNFSVSIAVRTLSGIAIPIPRPVNLRATSSTDTNISLIWEEVLIANRYIVDRYDGIEVFLASTDSEDETLVDSDLTPDTLYKYKVQACNADGCSEKSNFIMVHTKLEAPNNLQGIANSNNITLSWDAVIGARRYELYKNNIPVATLVDPNTSTTDRGLPLDDTYSYTVRACNENGCSVSSDIIDVGLYSAPATPTGLSATEVGVTYTELMWDPTTGVTSYQILVTGPGGFRMVTVTDNFVIIDGLNENSLYNYYAQSCNIRNVCSAISVALPVRTLEVTSIPAVPMNLEIESSTDTTVSLNWDRRMLATIYTVNRYDNSDNLLASSDVPNRTFMDVGLSANTLYKYKVQACNRMGCSSESSSVESYTKLDIPSNLRASNITNTGFILNWDVVNMATSYRVNGAGIMMLSNGTADIGDLSTSTSYIYSVESCNINGCSLPASVTVTTLPDVPTGLMASGAFATSISLTWNAVDRAASYQVRGDGTKIINANSASITGLMPERGYSYEVRACNIEANCSNYSAPISVMTTNLATPPDMPRNVEIEDSTDTSITLSWNVVGRAERYIVNHYDRNEMFISSTDAMNNTRLIDINLMGNTLYKYKLLACNSFGCSVETSFFDAHTKLIAPSLQRTTVGVNSISLDWNSVSGATSYLVYRTNILRGTVSMSEFSDNSLVSGTPYEYYAQACNMYGCSVVSDTIRVVTVPDIPVGFNIYFIDISSTSIDLSWDQVRGASAYKVYREGAQIATVDGRFIDSGLDSDVEYNYSIRGCNISGCSSMSLPFDVRTLLFGGEDVPSGCRTNFSIDIDNCKVTVGGEDKILVFNVHQLQNIGTTQNLGRSFLLADDIDASATREWNGRMGFDPIGDNNNNFSGNFDGQGFKIINLHIDRTNYVGLFGYNTGMITSLGVMDINARGMNYVGAIAGYNNGGVIKNTHALGRVAGNNSVGGTVGYSAGNNARIDNVYALVSVIGNENVGGLVGYSKRGSIENSYSAGSVDGNINTGGLIGKNESAANKSYSIGVVSGTNIGGLVGSTGIGVGYETPFFWDVQSSKQQLSIGGTGLNTIQMQENSGLITELGDAWSFKTNAYPMLKRVNNNGIFDSLLPASLGNFQVIRRKNDMRLSWFAGQLEYYNILRGGVQIATVNTPSYTDSVELGAEYSYQIRGCNGEVCITSRVVTVTSAPLIYGEELPVSCIAEQMITESCKVTVEGIDWYAILNVSQMQDIRMNLDKNYVLGRDVEASITKTWNGGAGFIPIGDCGNDDLCSTLPGNRPFIGIFDGQGYTVSNIFINNMVDQAALFGLNEGTIDSLGISASVSGDDQVGALVGQNNGVIQNSYVTGWIGGNTVLGGIAAYNKGVVNNSYSTVFITGSQQAGGLVGRNEGIISNSYAKGSVVGMNNIGGLVGENTSEVSDSYTRGMVKGSGSVGGVIGNQSASGMLSNSYAAAVVVGDTNVGGLIGNNNGGAVNMSYWDIEITMQSTSSGSANADGLTTEQMQANRTPITNLGTAWVFIPDGDYSRLRRKTINGDFGELLPTLATGIDAISSSFNSTADSDSSPWYSQTNINNDELDAVQSGATRDNGESCLVTVVSGRKVSFYWKVSSEQSKDYLRFYVNGTVTAAISGEVNWERYIQDFGFTTTAELKWCYEKDGSNLSGFDTGWVDQLTIAP